MDSVDICLRDDPFALSLDVSELSKFCHFCLKQRNKGRSLKRCAKCTSIYYCSIACQRNDWEDGHQVECRRIVSFLNRVVANKSDTSNDSFTGTADSCIRLVARVVDKLLNLKRNQPLDPKLQAFANLRSVMVGIVGSADERQRLRFDEFSESYALFVGRASKKIDKVGLLAIYSKVVCNRFALKDGNQNIIGVGLYPNLCRIGHSCRPTGAVVFHERTAIVVPTRSKSFPSPLDWSLISRSYPDVDPISAIETRKDKLKSEYFIDCHCELCEDAAANETMEAFACSKSSCLGRVAIVDGAFVCGKCGKEFDENARNQAYQSLQRIDSLFDPEYSQRSLKDQLHCILDCMHFTQTILHKYNIKRLTVLKAAYDGCVLEKRPKEAINFGRQSLEIYRHYLDEFDPFLAAFTLNLATTYMHAGELDTASQLMHSIIDRCEHIYAKQSEALNYIDPSFEEVLAKLSLGDMGL